MSLSLSFVVKDQKDKGIEREFEKEISESHNDLFEVEVCRKKLWGHEVIKELGCNILYSLICMMLLFLMMKC